MKNSKQWQELDSTGYTVCKSRLQAHKLATAYQDYHQVEVEFYYANGNWCVSVIL